VQSDITERKKLEDQLRQAQRWRRLVDWLAGLLHDFNNLLTIISGYSELVLAYLRWRPMCGNLSKPSAKQARGRHH